MKPPPDRVGDAQWLQEAGRAARLLADGFRLMVGVPNYGTYLRHMEAAHPGQPAMDYETFFRERQRARYAGGSGRCC